MVQIDVTLYPSPLPFPSSGNLTSDLWSNDVWVLPMRRYYYSLCILYFFCYSHWALKLEGFGPRIRWCLNWKRQVALYSVKPNEVFWSTQLSDIKVCFCFKQLASINPLQQQQETDSPSFSVIIYISYFFLVLCLYILLVPVINVISSMKIQAYCKPTLPFPHWIFH